MFWYVVIISVVIIALAFAGIGIKMFFGRGRKFERHCASEGGKTCHCKGGKCKSEA